MTDRVYKRLHIHDDVYTKNIIALAQRPEIDVCVWGAGFNGKNVAKELLSIFNIKIDYFCDSDESIVGKEVVEGIFCRDIQLLIQNKNNTVCFMALGVVNADSGLRTLFELGVENIVTYDDLLNLDEVQKYYLPFMKKKDTAIYTCITGDYDLLREPEYLSERCDYYVITEREPSEKGVYQWINIMDVLPEDLRDIIIDNSLKMILWNRWCKLLPHLIFGQYKYSIYIDGNMVIIGGIEECIEHLKRARLGVAGSNYTDNPYVDGIKGIVNHADNVDICIEQLQRYWMEGLPQNAGNYHCAILIREHNHPVCISLMEQWWEEFRSNAKRDQFGLPYVLWKNGYTKEDVFLICDEIGANSWNSNPYWRYEYGHIKKARNQLLMERMNRF